MKSLTEKSISELINDIPGVKSISSDNENNQIIFHFANNKIEISSHYVFDTEHSKLTSLIKSLNLPQKDFRAKSTKECKVSLNIPKLKDEGYYSPKEIEELGKDNAIAQRIKAKPYIKEAVAIANKLSSKSESDIFTSSKWRSRQLREAMESLRVELAEVNIDSHYINKQNETVYQREIFEDGLNVGIIEYLEDDNSVTILRSDVKDEYQGQGIGFNAYTSLINEKISQGKSVGSDSILSPQAQRIYQKLEDAGYRMSSQYSRIMTRGKITSLSREDTMSQRNSFPIVNIDGVGTTDTGYRFKGESLFTIEPSMGVIPSPVISITEGSIVTSVYPSYVEVSSPDILKDGDCKNIELHLMEARKILTNSENKGIRDSLIMDNVVVLNSQIISYDELDRIVEMELNKEKGMEY